MKVMMRKSDRSFRWLLISALLAVVSCVYWPGLHGGYIFDDYPNIVDNTTLHVGFGSGWRTWLAATFSSPSSDLQRPLAMLSFAFNHAMTGLDPYWMKLTNLGIHLLNTLLVYGLTNRLLSAARAPEQADRRQWTALWIAAAWALNPINLMAVLFVVQRMESLCHLFVFSGLWAYLVGRERLLAQDRGWTLLLAGLVVGTLLGLLSKESSVLLPLYALALEWALLRFSSKARACDRRMLLLFGVVLVLPVIIGLGWLLPRVLASHAYDGRAFSLTERLLTEARVVLDYLHWTLLPDLSQLSLYHDDYVISRGLFAPPATALALGALLALGMAAIWLRRRRPVMALGIAWFLAAQLLTATIIPLELVFEHRNYFASLGLMLALGDLFLLAPVTRTMRRAGIAAAALLLVLYAGLTTLRAREWQDPLRFALSEAAKHPMSPRASYDVARDFILISAYRKDAPEVDRAFQALEHTMRIPGAGSSPPAAAIILASRTGRPLDPEWWASLQAELRARPPGPQDTSALASLVDCQINGHCQLPITDMQRSFSAALAHGRNPEVLSIYGNHLLNTRDDPRSALRLWQEAAQRAPKVAQYQVSCAKLLIALGRPDLARPYIERLRHLGRLGQNEAMARELEQLAADESRDIGDRSL
jgi:hypothetical protein